jgi:hypothetical protein
MEKPTFFDIFEAQKLQVFEKPHLCCRSSQLQLELLSQALALQLGGRLLESLLQVSRRDCGLF